ncbi:YjdF family protein [Paenibacillus alba]|uniref:YjdF family protein n=1 Tax=Paenibacillus alba TaxID=1197127 RepID=A0ABU6GBL7_9BACL|nr:YjdF family protein [Paenibacillus alba]MEC0231360.1 YjdF family protein [Paenibacillus alba]
MKLTVYFNGQFWIGVVEHENENGSKLKACQFLFGAEPKDGEVWDFVQHHMLGLLASSSQQVNIKKPFEHKINPKRLARQIAKELKTTGVSTFAQAAMKLELASRKKERKAFNKQQHEEYQDKKYQLRVQKAKEKHRGK